MVMCLAIPARVMSIEKEKAQVDFGEGILREVNVSLVDIKIGDYVLVHAGYAIQVLDEREARETVDLWKEILAADAEYQEQAS
ncbi:MAG: HypC/HybG/HupF family hydrogenase formation chaperone [Candidatus Bathycorpusculaceae bacterium]